MLVVNVFVLNQLWLLHFLECVAVTTATTYTMRSWSSCGLIFTQVCHVFYLSYVAVAAFDFDGSTRRFKHHLLNVAVGL